MEYNLKNIKQDFKNKGIYYTQPELALYMKSLIDIDIRDVYDPTCGDGALLACFDDNLPKYGQELNKHQLEKAQERLLNFNGYVGDTLIDPAFMDKRFSCIMANPPFSIEWTPPQGALFDERFMGVPTIPTKSRADYAFILHILHLLADNGIAIVLNFPGILYRGGREADIRKWIIQNNWIEKVIHVPGNTFIDTTIATALIIFKKDKTSTDIEFIDNEIELSRTVSIEEIKKNDYILSVNTYVQKEEEKTYVNPDELQELSRRQMIAKLRADIEVDKMICELAGYNFQEYLSKLIDVIREYQTLIPP